MKNVPFLLEAFAEVLKNQREMRNLTQRELSVRMESARSLISFFENSKNIPSLQTFFVIADALGTTPRELLDAVTTTMERLRASKEK